MFTGTSYPDLGACENSGQWRDNGQDSSGSDHIEGEDDEQQTRSLDTKPCFIIGGDQCDLKQSQQITQTSDSISKPNSLDISQSSSEQIVRII